MISMVKDFFTGKWSVYLAGLTFAFLFVFSLYVLNSPVGMSNAYLMISEYCEQFTYMRIPEELPLLDWQTGFLLGIIGGALAASIISGKWKIELFPGERKQKDFLASSALTPVQGLVGGFLVMLGLQLGGDSFLGQWAAAIQFSTGAWVFLICAFFTATLLSVIIYAVIMKDGGENK